MLRFPDLDTVIIQDFLGSLLAGRWGWGHWLGHGGQPYLCPVHVLCADVKQPSELRWGVRLAFVPNCL